MTEYFNHRDCYASYMFLNNISQTIVTRPLDIYIQRDHYVNLTKVHKEIGYNNYLKKTKEENDRVYTWMLVGKRLGVCKDVRTLIAEEIWHQFFDEE